MTPTRRPIKIGMIFECGPQGPDQQVCEHLARQLLSDVQIEPVTLVKKTTLIERCGAESARLLKIGCERVVIVWDLNPDWGRQPHCRGRDRQEILDSLRAAEVDLERVALTPFLFLLAVAARVPGPGLSAVYS